MRGRGVGHYRAMRWPELDRILRRLGYETVRQSGSHRTLKCEGRPTLHLGFHDSQELSGGLVRKILVNDVGLSDDEARWLV